jgi:hypothetical protein
MKKFFKLLLGLLWITQSYTMSSLGSMAKLGVVSWLINTTQQKPINYQESTSSSLSFSNSFGNYNNNLNGFSINNYHMLSQEIQCPKSVLNGKDFVVVDGIEYKKKGCVQVKNAYSNDIIVNYYSVFNLVEPYYDTRGITLFDQQRSKIIFENKSVPTTGFRKKTPKDNDIISYLIAYTDSYTEYHFATYETSRYNVVSKIKNINGIKNVSFLFRNGGFSIVDKQGVQNILIHEDPRPPIMIGLLELSKFFFPDLPIFFGTKFYQMAIFLKEDFSLQMAAQIVLFFSYVALMSIDYSKTNLVWIFND